MLVAFGGRASAASARDDQHPVRGNARATQFAPARQPRLRMTPLAPASVAGGAAVRRQLGVTLPWSKRWASSLDRYTSLAGRAPAVIQTWRDMSATFLNPRDMRAITARGAIPLVTLEPGLWTNPRQPAYALARIASGKFDSWFSAAATQAATYGKPFYLRFAPEMNGAWEPWGPGANGNTAADYVNAWHHVWSIFAARRAKNVIWVWSPNVLGGADDFAPYYPGSS